MTGPRAWVPEDGDNRLAEFRTKAGLTLQGLATLVGVNYRSIRAIELCEMRPVKSNGALKPWVETICRALSVSPELVFPFEMCSISDEGLTDVQMEGISRTERGPDLDDKIEYNQVLSKIYEINSRYAKIVKMRSENYEYEEIADAFGISMERARQIYAVAVRKVMAKLGVKYA